jgi:hypothetical protein
MKQHNMASLRAISFFLKKDTKNNHAKTPPCVAGMSSSRVKYMAFLAISEDQSCRRCSKSIVQTERDPPFFAENWLANSEKELLKIAKRTI